MSTFITFGIVFIPTFMFYNLWCSKNKNLLIWIDNGKYKVIDDNYYAFQFKSSVVTCLSMVVLVIVSIPLKLDKQYLLLFLLVFYFSIYASTFLAQRKSYIAKINRK